MQLILINQILDLIKTYFAIKLHTKNDLLTFALKK